MTIRPKMIIKVRCYSHLQMILLRLSFTALNSLFTIFISIFHIEYFIPNAFAARNSLFHLPSATLFLSRIAGVQFISTLIGRNYFWERVKNTLFNIACLILKSSHANNINQAISVAHLLFSGTKEPSCLVLWIFKVL